MKLNLGFEIGMVEEKADLTQSVMIELKND